VSRNKLGKFILTFVLASSSVMSFPLDWSANHLLNPAWHPHARFHGALLLFLLAGVAATGVWLLWRESREPRVAIQAAALISASYWSPFFYITTLLPSSTPWAGTMGPAPRIGGVTVYPNLVVAGVFLLLTAAGYWLGSAEREGKT
jgi:hypothetical protein